MIRIALILILWASAATSGLKSHAMTIDGQPRKFLLYVPDRLAPADARKLVVVLHGGGGSARQILRSTRRQFNALAERDGWLVAYPDAIGRIWDLGEGAVSGDLDNRRDDLRFLTSMIGAVTARHDIDRAQVFATGISRGGQASFMLACKSGGMVRAIVSVAMSMPEALADDCATIRPTGLLMINGTADPLVPYGGGAVTVRNRARDLVLSTPASLEFFAIRNRCARATRQTRTGNVLIIEHRDCRAPTVLMRIEGGGHTWPGERSVLPARIVGPTSSDIDATREIWRFFGRF